MSRWPRTRLGNVATPVERPESPLAGTVYRQIGVKLWGAGAYEREPLDGSQTKYSQLYRAEAGDIIVNKIWARNGSVAVVSDALAGCFGSSEFPMFSLDTNKIIPAWIHWLTKTRGFWMQCDERSRGTSGQNRIKPEQFLNVEIPLPPLEEQLSAVKQIENFAARVDEARTLRQQANEETDALTKAQLNILLGNPYKDIVGQVRFSKWSRLHDVVDDVADGPHITPTYVPDGIPFITVLNITSGRLRFGDHKYITIADHHQYQRRAKAEPGDVLISKDGTIGIPCLVDTDRPFSFFVSVALVKPKRDVLDGEFLTWIIRAPYLQDRIKEKSRGDMIRHLVLREIRDLVVPVPSLSEQRRMVAEFNALQAEVDALRRLQNEATVEINALLPAMLDRTFNGGA